MKLRLIVIAAVIFLLMGSTIVFLSKQNQVLKQEKGQLIQVAQDSGRIARTYINLHGHEVSRAKILDLTYRNFKALKENQEFAFLNQFDGLKKNKNNLEQIIKAQAEVIATFKTKTGDTTLLAVDRVGDTVRVVARSSHYKDEFNEVDCLSTPDSTTHKVQADVTLKGVVLWEHPKWWKFWKRVHYSEFTSPNPWVKIKQHEIIKVQKK